MNINIARTKNPIALRLKPRNMAVLCIFFSVLVLSGCTTVRQAIFSNGTVSKKVFRAYFDMPASTDVNENTVREAVLTDLPIGAISENQIYGFLDRRHVSRSSSNIMAFYDLKNQQNEIKCSLSYNPEPSLRTTFHITFFISDQKLLKNVSVEMSQVSI